MFAAFAVLRLAVLRLAVNATCVPTHCSTFGNRPMPLRGQALVERLQEEGGGSRVRKKRIKKELKQLQTGLMGHETTQRHPP